MGSLLWETPQLRSWVYQYYTQEHHCSTVPSAFSFDDSGRVLSVVHKNAAAATLSYSRYGYDNADRLTSESWQSGGTPGARSYGYDGSNQLTSDGTTTYSYDGNGNRTLAGYQTGTDNRLMTDGVWTYTYDAEGNTTVKSKG